VNASLGKRSGLRGGTEGKAVLVGPNWDVLLSRQSGKIQGSPESGGAFERTGWKFHCSEGRETTVSREKKCKQVVSLRKEEREKSGGRSIPFPRGREEIEIFKSIVDEGRVWGPLKRKNYTISASLTKSLSFEKGGGVRVKKNRLVGGFLSVLLKGLASAELISRGGLKSLRGF